MWFLSAPKTRRRSSSRASRAAHRPRLELLEDRCLMSAGALDVTFGGPASGSSSPAGTVLGPSGINVFNPSSALVVYPNTGTNPATDGKTVGGGWINVTTKHGTTSDFALVRYKTDGSLDTGFGNGGVVSTLIGTSAQIRGLALQSDGKIVAVGTESDGTNNNFVVARYTPAGALDSSFGTNSSGFVVTHLVLSGASMSSETANAVAIQGDGKIDVTGVVGFTIGTHHNVTSGLDFAIVRYNGNGNFDTTFGSGGIAITPNFGNAPNDEAYGLGIQSDGKIVLAGVTSNTSPSAMAVVRYTTTGVLDSSFGSSGIVTLAPPNTTEAGAFGVVVQSDGGIVLSGYGHYPNEEQTLARLTPGGALDTTFGNSGFVINSNMINGHNIVQAANGDLLTAGTAGTATFNATDDFAVAAFLSNGTPDTTFGNPLTPGTNSVDISGAEDLGQALALQSDGKIVVGGFSYNATTSTYSAALARFLPPATKITSFTANPNPVAAGSPVTLSASGILNSNPTATTTQVAFYLDANSDGTLEPTTDTLLGYGTNSGGVWTFTFTPTTSGTFTLFAQAMDSSGVFSDPVAITIQVI